MSHPDSPVKVPGNQPDPVLVGPGLTAFKDEAYTDATNATPSLDADKKNQLESDAPSYLANIPATQPRSQGRSGLSSIPEQAAQGNPSGQDLLRRLSLVELPEIDPRIQHPGLRLSGRLISATFCLPYKLYFEEGADWVCGGSPTREYHMVKRQNAN